MSQCPIVPLSAFQSTNLSSQIKTYRDLGDRILRNMGMPLVRTEVTDDMLFENIAQACEMFTKYAGYTEEYLVFNSNLYEQNRGIRLDHLFTQIETRTKQPLFAADLPYLDTTFVVTDTIPFSDIPTSLIATFPNGLQAGDLTDVSKTDDPTKFKVVFRGYATTCIFATPTFVQEMSSINPDTEFKLTSKPAEILSVQGSEIAVQPNRRYRYFDYDTMNYRKVVSVIDFNPLSNGLNFINDNMATAGALMAQPNFNHALGMYGFDLVTFYIMKDWLKIREKILATRTQWQFNDRTQYLRLMPQPKVNSSYCGLVRCYVEKPLTHIVCEMWVQQYALALTKIQVAHVRGQFQNLSLFGGGTVNYGDLMSQGVTEKKELEHMLFEGASAGMGDSGPPKFFVG